MCLKTSQEQGVMLVLTCNCMVLENMMIEILFIFMCIMCLSNIDLVFPLCVLYSCMFNKA